MDQTQLPSDGNQSSGSQGSQGPGAQPVASPMHPQTAHEHDDFPEDVLLEDEAAGWNTQFVAPFQQSGPMPAVNPQTARARTNQTGAPTQGRTTQRRFPVLKVALISSLIALAMGFLAFSVFAQPASHLTPIAKHPTQGPSVTHTAPTAKPTRREAHGDGVPRVLNRLG
jgi:hypothetical protein